MTFAQAVASVRVRVSEDRWRLASFRTLAYWMEFTTGWMGAASILRAARADTLPEEIDPSDADGVLAWAWGVVGNEVNSVLMTVDQRTPIPSALVVSHFSTLSGNCLIFPDGSVHPLLVRAIERKVQIEESRDNRTLALAALAAAKVRGIAAPMAKAKKKGRR